MTPLITEFVKVTNDAEKWIWFDIGNVPELLELHTVMDEDLLTMPYPRTVFCGVDTDGSKFCVALIAGDNHVLWREGMTPDHFLPASNRFRTSTPTKE